MPEIKERTEVQPRYQLDGRDDPEFLCPTVSNYSDH